MDQRSNAYGTGAGWPPKYGADVAYPTDEHPSHPPAPWASAPVDPSAWGAGPTWGPGTTAEPAWSQDAAQGQGYEQGYEQGYDQPYDQRYGADQAYGQGPGTWAPAADPRTGYGPGPTGPAWEADAGQPARTTGHDLGPITGPEWPAVPREAGNGYAAGGYETAGAPGPYAPAQDDRRQAWDQGGPGYAATAEPATGWDQRAGQAWDQGGPGYANDQTAYAGQQDWKPDAQAWDNHAQDWQPATGDRGGWDGRQQDGWDADPGPPAAAPGWGPNDLATEGAEWEDEADFDAAFGDEDDPWSRGEPGDERTRPRRGMVLILAVALVVLLGAVAGATWALTTRNAGTGGQAAGQEASAGADGQAATAEGGGASQAGDARQVESDEFSFAAPRDWQDITERARSASSVGSRVVTALARTRDDGTGSSIVVTAGANETGSEPSIAALGAALKARTESEGATKVSDPKPMNLADGDAVAVDYEGKLRGAPIAGRRVLTIHGDKAYVLVMEGSKDRFQEDLGAFDEVLASWTWKG